MLAGQLSGWNSCKLVPFWRFPFFLFIYLFVDDWGGDINNTVNTEHIEWAFPCLCWGAIAWAMGVFSCDDNIIITQTLRRMNDMRNYCDAAFVYNHTVIVELYFMSDVFTDDYLIGIQFHTVESSKTSIMHHCLIKVAFFFALIKSCHKNPLFTIPTCSPLTHNCITDCITLSRFNSPPAAYTLWNKDSSVCGIRWFFSDSLLSAHAHTIIPSIGWGPSRRPV